MWLRLKIDCAYRADVVVEGLVLVEIKAIDVVLASHRRQVNTYIRLGDYRVGLLLNFGAAILKHGIERIVNRFPDPRRLFSATRVPVARVLSDLCASAISA